MENWVETTVAEYESDTIMALADIEAENQAVLDEAESEEEQYEQDYGE